jgi:hypothetical protein
MKVAGKWVGEGREEKWCVSVPLKGDAGKGRTVTSSTGAGSGSMVYEKNKRGEGVSME